MRNCNRQTQNTNYLIKSFEHSIKIVYNSHYSNNSRGLYDFSRPQHGPPGHPRLAIRSPWRWTSPEGLPFFEIVGLPDAAVKESRERVFSALRNSGFHFEMQRTILNMAPADVRKEGPIYDLPIALGLLAALGRLRPKSLEGTMFLGELSLTGEVRGVRGALPMVLAAREAGIGRAALPADNAAEGTCVEGVDVLAVKTLKELVTLLNSSSGNLPFLKHEYWSADGDAQESDADDICRIKGQYGAKCALEVAAAGGHNLIMTGPPGTGKRFCAAMPRILPDLTLEEALQMTKIDSVGQVDRTVAWWRTRPFRAPHHTAMPVPLWAASTLCPGEISLAHYGVLFLDEMPKLPPRAGDAARAAGGRAGGDFPRHGNTFPPGSSSWRDEPLPLRVLRRPEQTRVPVFAET